MGTDYEVVCDIKMRDHYASVTGILLRSNLAGDSAYRLQISGSGTYYIQKIQSGTVTILGQLTRTRNPDVYIKTRFRIDGWQLSVEEYINSEWELVMVTEDTSEALACGYFGFCSESVNTGFYATFDNIEINKKEVV